MRENSMLKTFLQLLYVLPIGAFAIVGAAEARDPGSSTVNLAEPPGELVTDPLPIAVEVAYPNLRINRPVVMTGAGDGSGRFFIASQTGQIYVIKQVDREVEEPQLFIDLSSLVEYKDRENEEGLLGLAFHPKFASNGQFYVYYTTKKRPHVSYISEFRTFQDQPEIGDPQSERVLMEIQQPYWNHNGGTLLFGPDGYLYIGLGDGGKANDPLASGQDLSKLLGSILRIDVDRKSGGFQYAIPPDNPFADRAGVWPEIFAYGLRNVWRMSFDPETGKLWGADVGQNDWEEINLIVAGGNYGWSLREGGNPFTLNGNGSGPRAEFVDPIVEYPHTDAWGKSITGGAVYRGQQTPELRGYYLYGDYVSGFLWALKYDEQSGKVLENRPIHWQNLPVFTFGQTDDGEVLMSTMTSGGRIYKFVKK